MMRSFVPFSLVLPLLLAAGACSMVEAPQRPAYLVFFDKESARLDGPANGVVTQAAERAKQVPGAQVLVLGYAGNVGDLAADQALSAARAKAVAEALAADGVAPQRIVSQGRGKTNEDPAIARRRVEIEIRG